MRVIPDEVLEGVRRFNAREYFEAHEAWEDHWGLGPPEERALTLGLIKAAVALHHLRNGNARGWHWQLEKALPLLRENAHVWPELEAGELADALDSLAAQARFHGGVDEEDFPTIPLPRAESST